MEISILDLASLDLIEMYRPMVDDHRKFFLTKIFRNYLGGHWLARVLFWKINE
jgi:hypothetical protein